VKLKLAGNNLQEDLVDPAELKNAAKKALSFQRYIFRRTFGVLYAVWAFVMAIDLILPWALQAALGTPGWLYVASPVVQALIGLGAGVVTALTSSKATRTIALQKAVNARKPGLSKPWLLMAFYIVLFSAIATFLIFLRADALTVVYAVVLVVAAFMFVQLRRVFSQDVPVEGKIVVIMFGGFAAEGFVMSILLPGQFVEVPWIAIIFAWLFCALYALKAAPEDWVERTD
jgi:hypothetical protein